MLINNLIRDEEFFHHFQPIYNIRDWVIIGREVLFRSKEFDSPEIPFSLAKKEKQLYELDSRSIHKAVSTYHMAGVSRSEGKLFVNAFPSTILNKNFPTFIISIMSKFNVSSNQLVIEISETERINNFRELSDSVNFLKENGIEIALDDVGKGLDNVQKIIELNPDFIKLDKYFTVDLYKSKKKQNFVQFLQNYCDEFNSHLILEGLEKPIDVAFAKVLGIKYAQGYALAKPDILEKTV
jgi:EAL domain-containing protein (putative c-di-GMP-specific phosphodiesterase class I)